ncbi:MAG TPA: tRNA (adenosine(37)-N6)-threonylcarbamoyltransferase complex ATPase subunit type 1 TsaE [Solirubrobacteraceae bacterium]|nr:tRNA (adenosine(37)-N6)-threonylcarbamoyltransferase complex ATPase subunit type 1 TsaE [Solirubrobacteraceae bacterium]
MTRRVETVSAEQTEALGAELAGVLAAGDVVLVEGELGAGKTTFVRGACRALGVTDPVTSPTFTIGQRYAGRIPISHLDLYRLAPPPSAGERSEGAEPEAPPPAGALPGEDPALLADYLGPDTIAFVEWPQGGEGALGAHARIARRVRLSHAGGDHRRVEIE